MSRLFHVSDLHFGAEDAHALAWFADAARAERPDAIIMTGDLTMRARSHEFAAAEAWLQALDLPMTIEVGNHDLPYFNPLRRLFKPYGRYSRLARAIERTVDLPDVVLVPLRTTARFQWRLNWSLGKVGRARLERAIAQLATKPPGKTAIVTCHHPLTAPDGSAGKTIGGAAAVAILARAGADAILSGHLHDPFDIAWSDGDVSTRLIGAGTLSERTRTSPPSFNEIEIDGEAVRVTRRIMD